MTDRTINSVLEMRTFLAAKIASDTMQSKVSKFKYHTWCDGRSHLTLMSEHGWELLSLDIQVENITHTLTDGWRKNRWGEPVGRKTTAQIAKMLDYHLQAEVLVTIAQIEKEERNGSRNNINYYITKAQEIEKEFNLWLENSYKGNLTGMPKKTWVSIKVQLFDEVGNMVEPDMEKEA